MSQPKGELLSLDVPKPEELAEDSLQFLWAVSYCDFLLNLVCFLVVFFSIDDITLQARGLIALGDVKPIQAEVREEAIPIIEGRVIENLAEELQLEQARVIKSSTDSSIVLDFKDNIYSPGAYAFPEAERERLKRVLNQILPKSKNLMITFVGHADETRVIHRKGAVIDSNLVLSNLRAARAVEIAYQLGFDPKNVAGLGAGEFSRETRSISLKISEKNTR